MEGQITERETKNPIIRAINRKFGFTFGSEYLVPNILDHKIEQPLDINVRLKGSRESLQVFCETPKGTISFGDYTPEGTIFTIIQGEDAYKHGFESKDNKVFIPQNIYLLRKDTVYGLTHEISHLWIKEDPELFKKYKDAEILLGDKLNNNYPEEFFSKNSEDRKKEENALKTIREEEKKVTEIAFYIIGKLRTNGIDILPQCPTVDSLKELVNSRLKDYQYEQRLILYDDEIESLINGNLPYPTLKEKIDTRIARALPANQPIVTGK